MPETIITDCFDKGPCEPWPKPDTDCCDACDTEEAQELFDFWWEAVTEWLYWATCRSFPGCCPAETEPCPPCGCVCSYCDCGPWDTIDIGEAFCHPIKLDDDGKPCLEFVFPQDDGTDLVLGPDSGVWKLRPDLVTVDWCEPFSTSGCGSSWPANDHCDPWTVRAITGCEPPKMLLLGAERFVCEIVKDCQGKDSCLPDGVRSITRRGLTMDVGSDIAETVSFDNQGTGIPQLDFALRQWGAETSSVHAHFDPLAKLDEITRRCWSYRGIVDPTPPTCAGE